MTVSAADRRRPVIVVAAAEAGLAELRGELESRYGRDYRVVAVSSAGNAAAMLDALRADGVEVALILADQRLPDQAGVDLLATAHQVHPLARRGLLITWGDPSTSGAILRASSLGRIDYFVPKPVFRPDERFHRAVTEFLDEWWELRGGWFEVFRVVGDERSPRAQAIRDILHRNGLPFGFYPADSPVGRAILDEAGVPAGRLPVLVLFDGRALADPTNAEVAEALGVNVRPRAETYDLVIVGAGPSGLAAAVYGASEGLTTALVEHEAMGGQAGTSSLIRNYPGFPRGISGAALALRAYEQAWVLGAEPIYGSSVTGLRAENRRRVLTLSNGTEVTGRAVVVACGVSYRRLGVPDLEALVGAGVFYGAAVPEARALAGEHVFVVGGANSAGQAAMHLARYARKVTLLVRAPSLVESMSDYLVRQIAATSSVEVRFGVEVVGGGGPGHLGHLELRDRASGRVDRVPAAALFVLVGAEPHTAWLPTAVPRDRWGYVLTGDDLPRRPGRSPLPFETGLSGVFAVGDVRHGSVKRVASAVGEGAVAIRAVHDHLARR